MNPAHPDNNTVSYHVAGFVALAAIVIFALHYMGFYGMVTAGFGKGR